MTAANLCPVPGCTGHQKPGKLMCLRHWRMVSDQTQREVYQTWRAFSRAPVDPRDNKFRLLRLYRAARDKAVGEAGKEQAASDGSADLQRLAQATEGLMP